MRRFLTAIALVVFATAASPQSGNPLQQAVAEGAASLAWKIPSRGISICCCDDRTWNSEAARIEYTEVLLVAEFQGGQMTGLRMREPGCPVTAQRLVTVTADQSLDFLEARVGVDEESKHVIAAIATHDHPRVVPELIELARHHDSPEVRRHALFWLGQRAGEKAAAELRRAVDDDPDADVRKHAVFAIAQLPKERSVPMLIELVKTHKSAEVRKRAMFWLAQSGDQRALALIEEILAR
jgi:HEAT repeat protein